MFIDTLTDDQGREYEYGHCYDDNHGTGCGMEYAYYPATQTLEHWHDAVGLVTTTTGFTQADRDALDTEHDQHMMRQLDYGYDVDPDTLVLTLWDPQDGSVVDTLVGIDVPFVVSDHGNVNVSPTVERWLRELAESFAADNGAHII